MKYLGYILRNARRNKLRSFLTIGSIAVCGFLTMLLLSLFATNKEVGASIRDHHRIISMSSSGLAGNVPIAVVNQVIQVDEQSGENAIVRTADDKPAVSPLSWFGGRYRDDKVPFAQFGCDPDTIFTIYDELKLMGPGQEQAFRDRLDGVVIGRKLAEDKGLKVGDPFPLKGDIYPVDLDLTVVGIFDGPPKRDLRSCYFHWKYLRDTMQKQTESARAENAGTVLMRLKSPTAIPTLSKAIDDAMRNSDTPTKTQTEEAFVAMFSEFIGDLQTYINWVGMAVAMSLVMICGVSMAMTMRERTTEVAVLKAIGFPKGHVLFLVLTEAVLIAGVGGLIGSIGTKFLFDVFDIAPYTGGFFPFFYVPWNIALMGLIGSLVIGLVSGLIPALGAANTPVVEGLRKVV